MPALRRASHDLEETKRAPRRPRHFPSDDSDRIPNAALRPRSGAWHSTRHVCNSVARPALPGGTRQGTQGCLRRPLTAGPADLAPNQDLALLKGLVGDILGQGATAGTQGATPARSGQNRPQFGAEVKALHVDEAAALGVPRALLGLERWYRALHKQKVITLPELCQVLTETLGYDFHSDRDFDAEELAMVWQELDPEAEGVELAVFLEWAAAALSDKDYLPRRPRVKPTTQQFKAREYEHHLEQGAWLRASGFRSSLSQPCID